MDKCIIFAAPSQWGKDTFLIFVWKFRTIWVRRFPFPRQSGGVRYGRRGKEIDTRWICPAILFCIFIVVMYGFARIVENDDIRHHDASPVYDRSKQMDDSRHHDAEQIFDRMGRTKLY